MKVTINNETIELKIKLRAIMIYEQITGRQFTPTTMTDMMLYMYSVILSCKPNITLDFMEFMDWLDENPNVFKEFNDWLIQTNKVNGQFGNDSNDLKKNLSK